MKLFRLWIPRELTFIFWFLATDFNFGIIPCASYYMQPEKNSTEHQNLQSDHLSLVLNKSKVLEDIIHFDLLQNLRTLVRIRNPETESPKEFNKSKKILKIKKTDCNNENRIESLGRDDSFNQDRENDDKVRSDKLEFISINKTRNINHSNAPFYNAFLNDAEEKTKDKLTEIFPRNSYMLGYSGNPFGSRKLMTESLDMPQDLLDERVVTDPRKKRSVLHLYNMVLCSTGCNPITYKGYGCYCGFLGSGFVVDGIDSCCKMHDWCYNSAGCPMFLEYFIPYLWKCYHRQPLCAMDHEYYGSSGSCSQRLCECDRQLALCLRRYPCPTTKAICTSSPWRLLQNILML